MNSTDKRIEELLNRAGQTIIKDYDTDYPHDAVFRAHMGHIAAQHGGWYRYVLRLTEIIDRFEWALENVCNERDYLAYRLRRYRDCQSCERVYECERTPDHCLGRVFGGVPEDWSADDE